jgi:hypothetical protein
MPRALQTFHGVALTKVLTTMPFYQIGRTEIMIGDQRDIEIFWKRKFGGLQDRLIGFI